MEASLLAMARSIYYLYPQLKINMIHFISLNFSHLLESHKGRLNQRASKCRPVTSLPENQVVTCLRKVQNVDNL